MFSTHSFAGCKTNSETERIPFAAWSVNEKTRVRFTASITRKNKRMIYESKAFIATYHVLHVRVRIVVTENSNTRRNIQIFVCSIETAVLEE